MYRKIGALSQLGVEKITFPSKPDRRTYGLMDRRKDIRIDGQTDISNYRVASLLKRSRKLKMS